MGAAQFGDDRLVARVEMEAAGEVVFADGIGEAAVPCPLDIAPQARWHSQNSRVLRRKLAECENKGLSLSELPRIAETIEEKNAGLQSIAEPWADTTSPAGRIVLTVFAGIAGFERSLIATRTEEGRRAAQARGVPFGRPPKLRPDQRTLARHLIDEGKSVSEVARTFNVHVATIYRCLHDQAAL